MIRNKIWAAALVPIATIALGSTSAAAYTPHLGIDGGNPPGHSEDAPGQDRARGQCGRAIQRQAEHDHATGENGVKNGSALVINCDHYWTY